MFVQQRVAEQGRNIFFLSELNAFAVAVDAAEIGVAGEKVTAVPGNDARGLRSQRVIVGVGVLVIIIRQVGETEIVNRKGPRLAAAPASCRFMPIVVSQPAPRSGQASPVREVGPNASTQAEAAGPGGNR